MSNHEEAISLSETLKGEKRGKKESNTGSALALDPIM